MNVPDKRPHIEQHPGGTGVQVQRTNIPDKRPHVDRTGGGEGVQVQRTTFPTTLKSPYPYYGGKSRFADIINKRLGKVGVYVEPFAGSLAVLLSREPSQREIVNDNYGYIPNFWRAIANDPDAVAYWADYPTYHHDLTARHRWLVDWGKDNFGRLSQDADWYDAKAAGWWCWGISSWIGGGFCIDTSEQIPHIKLNTGGQGVQAQRINVPDLTDPRPLSAVKPGGQGVQVQRITIPHDTIGDGSRLQPWFHALAQRLSRVVVLYRDWSAAVTPTLLQHTATAPKPPVGILLDPPYRTDTTDRSTMLYHYEDASTDTATAAYQWAIAHGDTYRIAYCCHEGDFPLPDGWTAETASFGGQKVDKADRTQDMVMFSPACVEDAPSPQMSMF